MSQTYAATWKVQVLSKSYVNALDLGNVTDSVGITVSKAITNGTSANNAQHDWHDQRTLTTGATEDLDLQALSNAFGDLSLTKLKLILIEVTTTTTGYTLKLKAGASNGFSAIFSDPSDELIITNGGCFALLAPGDGYTVDATHKVITISNPAGGSVTYNIMVAGLGSVS